MQVDVSLSGAARSISGPLLFLSRAATVGLNSAVEVVGKDGQKRIGRVTGLDEENMIVEVLESTSGLGLNDTTVRIKDKPIEFAVGPDVLGRILDGVGRPLDGGPPVSAAHTMRIDGLTLNPARRNNPQDFIETGVTAIDLLNSLVRGQKLPLFSGSGLPHDQIASQIAQHARLPGNASNEFALVFVGIGVPHETAEFFRTSMEQSGALEHAVLFLSLADQPSAKRILAPRFALTAAEYLAFHEGRHVLVILTDMTNYCESLREVSASHGEIPSRKGYPGYMYSDLATIYERAGCIHGLQGSVTQLPLLTMPGDDITHPIPDLTGYITEGQIVLDRGLDRQGIHPPVQILPSLSRLMDRGTGAGFTHPDHPDLAHQLFAAYARARRVRVLASVMGESSLSATDTQYLAFGDRFETELISQNGPRALDESLSIGWQLLADLPVSELTRLSDRQIDTYIMSKP